jgi:hypothetical protein
LPAVISRLSLSRRTLVVAVLAGSVFALSSGISVNAQKLPKDLGAYIAEADIICAKTNVALVNAAQKIETEKARSTRGGRLRKVNIAKPDSVATFATETAVPALSKLSTDLRAIPSPKGDEKTITNILDELDKGIAALKKDPRGATFNDPLKTSMKAFAAVRFGEVRFTACGVHAARDTTPKK